MDEVKEIAKQSGRLGGKAANKIQDHATKNNWKERAKAKKAEIGGKVSNAYKEQTSNDLARDAKVAKFGLAAGAGALVAAAAPAIAVATGLGAAAVVTVKESETVAKASSAYEEKTGRNVENDKAAVKSAAKTTLKEAKLTAAAATQGYKEVRK